MVEAPFKITSATLDVLEVLISATEGSYAYRVAKLKGLRAPTVTPILHRLKNCGWLTEEWEATAEPKRGPKRQFYRIDPAYHDLAKELLATHRPGSQQGDATSLLAGIALLVSNVHDR